MTDEPQGPGWWQASDLKWYPPEKRPDTAASPPTQHAGLSNPVALGAISPDAISSTAYGPEQILVELLPWAGMAAYALLLPITAVILLILVFVAASYRQVVTIYGRDGGGGVGDTCAGPLQPGDYRRCGGLHVVGQLARIAKGRADIRDRDLFFRRHDHADDRGRPGSCSLLGSTQIRSGAHDGGGADPSRQWSGDGCDDSGPAARHRQRWFVVNRSRSDSQHRQRLSPAAGP